MGWTPYFIDRKTAFLDQITKRGWVNGVWRAIRLFQQTSLLKSNSFIWLWFKTPSPCSFEFLELLNPLPYLLLFRNWALFKKGIPRAVHFLLHLLQLFQVTNPPSHRKFLLFNLVILAVLNWFSQQAEHPHNNTRKFSLKRGQEVNRVNPVFHEEKGCI